MISRGIAFLLFCLCCWQAWWRLGGRIEDAASAAPILIAAAGAVWLVCKNRQRPIPALPLVSILLLYATASCFGPALLQIGIAIAGVGMIATRATGRKLPQAPLIGAALLAMPILPTMDFLLAYPMRRISAAIAVALLRTNGISAGLEGVELDWHGRTLLFDAPCSGVRMLWTALLFASLASAIAGFGSRRYAAMLALGVVLAVAGNGLRAASLFYLENGFVAPFQGPAMHEAVGIAAFLMIGIAMTAAVRPKWRGL